MATINNSETIKRILNDASIQTAVDDVPNELGKTVVPVLISNPAKEENLVWANNISSSSIAGMVIYTTPNNKDFYLTYLNLSNQSDATADNTEIIVRANMGGVLRDLINMSKLTTTAFTDNIISNFTIPIKIDRGSNIVLRNVFTAGTSTSAVCLAGYTMED